MTILLFVYIIFLFAYWYRNKETISYDILWGCCFIYLNSCIAHLIGYGLAGKISQYIFRYQPFFLDLGKLIWVFFFTSLAHLIFGLLTILATIPFALVKFLSSPEYKTLEVLLIIPILYLNIKYKTTLKQYAKLRESYPQHILLFLLFLLLSFLMNTQKGI